MNTALERSWAVSAARVHGPRNLWQARIETMQVYVFASRVSPKMFRVHRTRRQKKVSLSSSSTTSVREARWILQLGRGCYVASSCVQVQLRTRHPTALGLA